MLLRSELINERRVNWPCQAAVFVQNQLAMEELLGGVHRFQQQEFGRYREIFRRLSREGQKPHTLFITCADSRVLAELITQSSPGDLFVVKNLGNIVPSSTAGGYNSTGAAIEFAVEVLAVSDIVVCGHSQCGAIAALMANPRQESGELSHFQHWISLAIPVRELIEQKYNHLKSEAVRIRAAEEENVLFSIERLQEYAPVSKRLREGTLRLHAWFFKIATGELFAYDPERRQFQPITGP